MKYMAELFSVGDEGKIEDVMRKLMAVRIHRRQVTVGDIGAEKANEALAQAGLTAEEAESIYYLTSLARFDDRFVIPANHREQAMELMEFAGDHKGSAGFGFKNDTAKRGL